MKFFSFILTIIACAQASRNDKPVYIAKKAASKPALDGTLDSAAWQSAAFSESFIDIRGTSELKPAFDTKMKIMWDEEFLYLGAVLEEKDVWSYVSQHNDFIYRQNAMEFFIDPNGDGENYFEFEINPLGTTWTLSVSKPYQLGGSGKTLNVPGMKTAVSVKGTVNNATDKDTQWSCEVALPWSFFTSQNMNPGRKTPPAKNDKWLFNAGRLNWNAIVVDGKYVKSPNTNDSTLANNWVWAQTDSLLIHTPDRWGSIVFS